MPEQQLPRVALIQQQSKPRPSNRRRLTLWSSPLRTLYGPRSGMPSGVCGPKRAGMAAPVRRNQNGTKGERAK